MGVESGGIFELEITDLAFGGDGVGRSGGKVWFVPFVIPGELVRVRAAGEKKSHGRAVLLEVLRPAPGRVGAQCPYFTHCGGCSYQHMDYALQMEWKDRQVRSLLQRIGGIESPPMQPPVAAPAPFGYRNRITVHVKGGRIGFHRAGGRGVVDVERCAIASDGVNQKLARFRRRRALRDGPCALRDYEDPRGFRQTHDAMAELLLRHVAGLVGTGGGELVDAYCGGGFLGRGVAASFGRVTGVDWSVPAIAAAREQASPNERYIEGDVAAVLPELLAEIKDVTLLLDPPAEGLPREVIDAVLAHPPQRVVYVSCNPATLARDAARLKPRFELTAATTLDMFPQTAEIECVAGFRRKEK